ncbi:MULTISPECIES: ABC transporter substrate-binding protein [unclassified Pseudomonas]|uniref:ABC transporter substrate-binding protein n=1 Tax=unclassified Pseudomonas TaxID=196821 RepID=UPI00128DA6A8|nr:MULTISPECIES: ABC transporter substrate-binding protein [unclassified Pseudomonas]MPQ66684.1 ABC transporter substrate-binding protein [Pseudomonas sp. MWU12-2323]
MKDLTTLDGSAPHPAVDDLCTQAKRGQISRRQFLHTATLLGITAASAGSFLGPALFSDSVQAAETGTPRNGGSLRFACAIQEIQDPMLITWIEASNLMRNSLEYLTWVDAQNITHPYLAESWKPSDDLKEWVFNLRQDVKWSNGDAFTADDVEHNFQRWTGAESKSVNRTAFQDIASFEKLGPYQFKLVLKRPILAIPEMLNAFTCAIVHRSFKAGDDWSKNPLGTGPFKLTSFAVNKEATFAKRADYWGKPAYLDELRYVDMGTDVSTQLAALQAGQVDVLYRVTVAELDLAKRLPNAKLLTCKSAQTVVMRMAVDQKPFDDLRIRKAVALCADNAQMLKIAYRGMGTLGEDHHVAPSHPEYFPLPKRARDVTQAKALLAEAGHPKGIDIDLIVGNTQGRYEQDTAQILQQNCLEAGIRINLKVIPATQYWPIWDKAAFSLTYWAHRPLGVMSLELAYRGGGAWNESHYKDPAFDAVLDKAMGIVDPKQRSLAMQSVEQILQDACVIIQPFWADKFTATSQKVQGFQVHPSDFYPMNETWLSA